MATDKRQFTMRMQEDTFEKIKNIASYEKRSIAAQIEVLIEREITRYQQENPDVLTSSNK